MECPHLIRHLYQYVVLLLNCLNWQASIAWFTSKQRCVSSQGLIFEFLREQRGSTYNEWCLAKDGECLRPYHVENTSSRLITEVKQHWALWVLGWVTTWEHRVLKTFLLFFCIYLRQFVTRGWDEWNVSIELSKRPSKYSLIHFYKRCVSKPRWISYNLSTFLWSNDTPLDNRNNCQAFVMTENV